MNEVLEYCFRSAMWSVLGLGVGIVIGRLSCVIEYRDSDSEDEDEDDTERPMIKMNNVRLFGVLLVILAAGTIFTYVQQQSRERCQNNFRLQVTQVTVARAQYADQDRAALVEFLRTLNGEPAPNQTDTNLALQHLLNTYDKTQAQRNNKPLPDLQKACG